MNSTNIDLLLRTISFTDYLFSEDIVMLLKIFDETLLPSRILFQKNFAIDEEN